MNDRGEDNGWTREKKDLKGMRDTYSLYFECISNFFFFF